MVSFFANSLLFSYCCNWKLICCIKSHKLEQEDSQCCSSANNTELSNQLQGPRKLFSNWTSYFALRRKFAESSKVQYRFFICNSFINENYICSAYFNHTISVKILSNQQVNENTFDRKVELFVNENVRYWQLFWIWHLSNVIDCRFWIDEDLYCRKQSLLHFLFCIKLFPHSISLGSNSEKRDCR